LIHSKNRRRSSLGGSPNDIFNLLEVSVEESQKAKKDADAVFADFFTAPVQE